MEIVSQSMFLDRPHFRVADLTPTDPAKPVGVVVLFERGGVEIDVALTAARARQLSASLLREAQRAERAPKRT